MTPSARERLRTLAVAGAGSFMAALSTNLVNVSAPAMARELGLAAASASLVMVVYLLAISVLLPAVGRLAEELGYRRIYLVGFAAFGAASVCCAVSGGLFTLVLSGALQGVAASMLMGVGPALVTRAFPPSHRARVLGSYLSLTYLGLLSGPTLGGLVVDGVGWRGVFALLAILAAGGTAFGVVVLPPEAPRDVALARDATPLARRLDLTGALLFAVALGALLLGMRAARFGVGAAFAAGALVASAAFVRHERRAPSPMLPLAMFRSFPFSAAVVGAMLLYTTTFMLSFALPFHLQHARGMSPRDAGLLMTPPPLVMAVLAPLSGWFADRAGARVPSVMGMGILAATFLYLARHEDAPVAHLAIVLAFVGAGAGLFTSPNNAIIMGAVPRDRQATASAVAAMARNLGMTAGVASSAAVLPATGAFHAVMVAAAALATVAAAFALVPRRGPREAAP